MDWKEAKDNTIRMWTQVRDSISEGADVVELLIELNAVTDLCEKSHQEAAGEWGQCAFCLAYQQMGGCQEVSGQVSDCIAAKEWEQARMLADEFIERLKAVELPPRAESMS
jgi:hypothetical protein